ncbi:hypothetical protein KIH23_02615 [Flavobacterium sp. CYK-55]|uniref:hypothetical protein n=1 Tax=Flavobacterium sp. CYK-55 TaxID=2835529 RepID=UPI001BD17046|nr:hypothetical protein [Flavobacterium sp. CYK-55]MBS7786177.1 hypothetical protein [Flavobacterium sp. CYK-55]
MNNTTSTKKSIVSKLTFHKLDWLEKVTLCMGLWFWIYPKPYTLLFTALLIIPILGLILNGLNGKPSIASLVEINTNEDGDDKYDVADFIDFAAIVIFIRVLKDYEFEDFYSLMIPGMIGFIIMIIIVVATHKIIVDNGKSKLWIYGSLTFNIFLYSYSATYGINCTYDYSKPQVYEAQILEKRISKSRKNTSYYVRVTPWGHHYDSEEISVAPSQYQALQTGQTVKIDLKKGVFNIPWYEIE